MALGFNNRLGGNFDHYSNIPNCPGEERFYLRSDKECIMEAVNFIKQQGWVKTKGRTNFNDNGIECNAALNSKPMGLWVAWIAFTNRPKEAATFKLMFAPM